MGIRAQLELAQAAVAEAGERARAADDRAAKAAAAAAARVAAAEHDTSAARQRADHCAVELAGARRRAREAQSAAEGSVTALQTALAASQRAADAAAARASTAERRCGTLTAALAKARAEAQQAGEAATQAAQHARAELDAAWAELAAVRSDSGSAEQLRCALAEAVAAREAAEQQVADMRAALALTAQQAEQWRARAHTAVNAAQEAVEAAKQAQVEGATTAAAAASVAAAEPAAAVPPACDMASQTEEQAPAGEGAAPDADHQPHMPVASFARLNPAVLAALRRRRRRAARARLARAMAYARAHGQVRASPIEAVPDASAPSGDSTEQQAAAALLEASRREVDSLRAQLEAAASAQEVLQEQLRTAAAAAHRASHRANAAEHRARAVVADAASLAAVEAALVSARQHHNADDAAGAAAQQQQHQLLTELRSQVTDLQAKLEATVVRAQEAEAVAVAATSNANAPAPRAKPAPSVPAGPVDGALERLAATWRAACASRDEAALQAAHERDDALAALAAARTSGGSAAEIAALRLALRTRERDVTELSRMLKAWEAMRVSKDGALRVALDRATAAEKEASDARAQLEALRRAASRGILVSSSASSDKENSPAALAAGKATSGLEVSSSKPLRTLSASMENSIAAMR